MRSACFFLFVVPVALAVPSSSSRTVPLQGFVDPTSWLTVRITSPRVRRLTQIVVFTQNVPETDGAHEPINLVLSGASDADVLNSQLETGGMATYFQCVSSPGTPSFCLSVSRSFGFSFECLGQHDAVHQQADLGDGKGYSAPAHCLFCATC
jgi:hypothetical protein